MIKLILFDLDGTIIDSELASLQAILDCTKEWGVKVTREDASIVVGRKWEEAFDLLFAKHSFPMPRPEAARRIVERYQEIVRNELIVVPGVVEAIEDFSKSFRIALVSGSHRADVLWALEKLGVKTHFELIYGAEDYVHSKPSPDGYLKAMKELGVSAEETVIFEDSVAGLASAAAAGVRAVAITSTNHFGHDQSKALVTIHDYIGVNSAWVRKNFR